jgi:solute carrier family 25 protein 34/35
MSRMYNQTGDLYKGAFDCLFKTIRKEGILAIYKGYFAHLARILPHTVSSFPLIEATLHGLVLTLSVDLDSQSG